MCEMNIFEEILGPTLLSENDAIFSPSRQLTSKYIVGLYFADWSKPCRAFTRKLESAYRESRASQKSMEIVFISMDEDEVNFRNAFAEMPWLAIPFDVARSVRRELQERFQARSVPCFVLLDGDSGRVMSRDGKKQEKNDEMVCCHNPIFNRFASLD
jgi:nucleoredoxin